MNYDPVRFFMTEAAETVAAFHAPRRSHDSDAGFDLSALLPPEMGEMDLQPFVPMLIHTGVCFVIPTGLYGELHGRSSLNKKGILSLGGIIDQGYTGEVLFGLINMTQQVYHVSLGQRIGQIIFKPYYTGSLPPVRLEDVPRTARGSRGFGSTGTHAAGMNPGHKRGSK